MTGNEIVEKIETIFPDAQCELFHDSTFQLVVAVILSAQTTDASVNKVTPKLFEAYPDAQSLAKAEAADVEPYIRSIGLYRSKAKNIVSMARDLMARFDGVVPSTYKELQSLAGVGRKTANVVRSVAFDIPSFAVDTHVDRVSKRLGLAKFGDSVEKVEEKLKRKIDRDRWNQAHHDFIFFGRYFCTARHPKCEECPFQSFCKKEGLEAYKKSEKQRLSKKNEQAKTDGE
ncbi:endonuclease III [uncultured Dubosiella sp.]|uniref:endonuclease III n=1 Tax=uncultured Dubosiella sp. TaxID=1937011 RepID=UPI00272AA8D8|nr:endonuclease III [uncultured Dubosiella sp.]